MKRLLTIELQKIWLNKSSRVLSIAYFVLMSLLSLVAFVKFDFGPFHIDPAQNGIFDFPFIWHFNTYIADFFKLFLAIIIVSMMANEYSYGTLKQNLIDGMSKQEFITSKFLTVVLFAFLSTFFIFIMSLILGYCYSGFTAADVVFSHMEYLPAYFVKLLGYFSFCLFVGILIKRSAFAIGFMILWFFIEKITYGIFKYKIFNESDKVDTFYQFMPLESMSNLIVEPFSKLKVIKSITKQVGAEYSIDYDVHFSNILVVLVWTSIFVFLSYKLLQKRDL
jgi:ABC-type transport system involved in multi-copper enzyme maturation permease subunit